MLKRLIFTFILIIIITTVFTGCNISKLTESVDPDNKIEVLFTVPKGASTKRIGTLLKENELIKSEFGFKELTKDLGADGKMKAGDYMISPSMTSEEIIKKLQNGDVFVETLKVTIPEGYELNQIITRLVEANLGTEEGFLEAVQSEFDYKFLEGIEVSPIYLEGFLFPATYEFKKGTSEKQIIDRLLSTFDNVFKDEYYLRAYELNMSINETLTLASIIEREAKLDVEREKISSVFHNRLIKGRALQSCATIQYALGERKERLFNKDLEIESPYNTYKYKGLPPGPIASPGEKSIYASLYPEDTDYLYFRTTSKNDGSHHFSKTFDEHVEAGK